MQMMDIPYDVALIGYSSTIYVQISMELCSCCVPMGPSYCMKHFILELLYDFSIGRLIMVPLSCSPCIHTGLNITIHIRVVR